MRIPATAGFSGCPGGWNLASRGRAAGGHDQRRRSRVLGRRSIRLVLADVFRCPHEPRVAVTGSDHGLPVGARVRNGQNGGDRALPVGRLPLDPFFRRSYVDAPMWASADSEPSWWQWARYCRMSGLLMRPLLAAGLYGVREIGSKSETRALRPSTGYWFSDPVMLTVCPYPFLASCGPHLPATPLLWLLLSPPAQAAARTR